MKQFLNVFAAAAVIALAGQAGPAHAQPASFCAPGATPAFAHGFAALKEQVGEAMGQPIECEHANAENGDSLQQTTTGLAFYRKSTNTPTFTTGWEHWAITAQGLVYWTGESIDPPVDLAPRQEVVVQAQGFGVGSTGAWGLGYGLVFKNLHPEYTAEEVLVHVAAADASGAVLGTDSTTLWQLAPGQEVGYGDLLVLNDARQVTRLDVTVTPTRWVQIESLPMLSPTDAVFHADEIAPTVSGVVRSPYTEDAWNVRVSTITYDGNGKINGGGHTYLRRVPALGETRVEVPVVTEGTLARVRLFAELQRASILETGGGSAG